MSSDESYKQKTRAVRRDAQERLRQLRKDRLARKEPPNRAPTDSSFKSRRVVSLKEHGRATSAEAQATHLGNQAQSDQVPVELDGPEQGVPSSQPTVTEPSLMESAENPQEPSSVSSNPEPDPSGDAVVDVTEAYPSSMEDQAVASEPSIPSDVADEATPEEQAVLASDLNSLPGAGVGLVWLLRECGVGSMQELADANPEVLSEQLGVVGRLVDVSAWIEHAANARH